MADLAAIPVQDYLGSGTSARINERAPPGEELAVEDERGRFRMEETVNGAVRLAGTGGAAEGVAKDRTFKPVLQEFWPPA
ncbi:MAG: hypothetical protein ACLR0U_10090 [Enterocloster clostridioformis]